MKPIKDPQELDKLSKPLDQQIKMIELEFQSNEMDIIDLKPGNQAVARQKLSDLKQEFDKIKAEIEWKKS